MRADVGLRLVNIVSKSYQAAASRSAVSFDPVLTLGVRLWIGSFWLWLAHRLRGRAQTGARVCGRLTRPAFAGGELSRSGGD